MIDPEDIKLEAIKYGLKKSDEKNLRIKDKVQNSGRKITSSVENDSSKRVVIASHRALKDSGISTDPSEGLKGRGPGAF